MDYGEFKEKFTHMIKNGVKPEQTKGLVAYIFAICLHIASSDGQVCGAKRPRCDF